jgi:CopG-like RHH_1 or ribbon-helix-helix domain, RHH_5
MHQYAFMRTTIDLPEDLYRTLKARAGLTGVTMRQLVQRLIEQGLRASTGGAVPARSSAPPPVIIPPRGVTIPAASRTEQEQIEQEEEDEARHAGPA